MKRLFVALMLCLVSIIGFVSCYNNSDSVKKDLITNDSIQKVEEQRIADSLKVIDSIQKVEAKRIADSIQHIADSIQHIEDSLNNIILKKYSGYLKRTKDEFNGDVKIEMPYNKIRIDKTIKSSGDEYYYLITTIDDSYCTVGGEGLTILFEDGTKFERSYTTIDCNYYGGGSYTYSCVIPLQKDEVKLFGEKKISKYKMFIFKGNINSSYATKFQNYSKCILLMK